VAGIIAASSVVGALVGISAAFLVGLVVIGPGVAHLGELFLAAGTIGAVAGPLVAPFAFFGLLRHVPLWRAFLETSVGTILGATVGLLLADNLVVMFVLAVSGLVVAALRLQGSARRTAQSARSEPTG
jgi:hypothetical protein